MPYFSANQLTDSLSVLKGLNTFLISLLAMFKANVPTTEHAADAVNYGAQNENALLSQYFRVPGLPPMAPYFVAFGPNQGQSVDTRYPGRTLQRLRKEAFSEGGIFWHPDAKRWSFRPGFQGALAENARFQLREVSIAALSVWFYRQKEIASVAAAVDAFIEEFGLDRGRLVGLNFVRDVNRLSDQDLRDEPLDDVEVAELLGTAPPAVEPPTRAEFEARFRLELSEQKVEVDEALLQALLVGWLSREIVVLVGAPGTGKSTIAHALPDALRSALQSDDAVVAVTVQITSETDVSAMMGYQNLEGAFVASEFSEALLLTHENQLKACVVVLDEFNLANVDAYLAPVLAAIESRQEISLSSGSGSAQYPRVTGALPIDTFVVATCNSFVEEPDTRLPLSRPVKRRCTILTVSNILADAVARDGIQRAFSEIGGRQLLRELEEVDERLDVGSATSFDRYRSQMLHACSTYEDLAVEVRELLEAIGRSFLATPAGRRFFTIGVFRDILVSVVMTPAEKRIAAVAQQFVSKLVHVYSGSIDGLRAAADHLKGKPGYDAVDELLSEISQRFDAGGEVLPLL